MILRKIIAYCKVLTKFQAQKRYKQIQTNSVNYSFHLCLNPGQYYKGIAQIEFKVSNNQDINQEISIDFQGRQVTQININGQEIKQYKQYIQPETIKLPINMLHLNNQNHISISYNNKYDNDGSGCISFIDVDSKQYLYTQFQPSMASRVFPLFDQPNLKASMKLAIACPAQWPTVISNQHICDTFILNDESADKAINKYIEQTELHQQNQTKKVLMMQNNFRTIKLQQFFKLIPHKYKLTYFKRTPILSSYLYCFVVGPYKQLICHNTYRNIPMSIYCIESLQPYLIKYLAPFIQQITNQSFQFFEEYFQCQYPFKKYDQVFAHEYKWGAMQNAGIVTINDVYLFRQKVSIQKMMTLGNTIVHELAHHWFGNFVTMKWWDDLWLNQSFAEYISHFCMQKIKKRLTTLNYESAMLSFFNRKGWGYIQDQMITTHPICSQVKDTLVAESIFDGITYSKGAAVLKQLMYLMGQHQFSSALARYFRIYAFRNAELADLLQCMQPYYDSNLTGGVSLQSWKQMWLEKAGLNHISCVWSKNSINVTQKAIQQQNPTLRIHRIKIALIDEHNIIHPIEATIKAQKTTIINYETKIKLKAVFLNYDDLSFVKISLDLLSLSWLNDNIKFISDTLLRAMIWYSLYEMVRDGELSTEKYCKFVLNNIGQEKSDVLLEGQLTYLLQCIRQYTPQQYRDQLFGSVFQTIKSFLLKNILSDNQKIILHSKLIQSAQIEIHKAQILDILQGRNQQFHWQLTILQSWKIIAKIFTMFHLKKQQKWQIFHHIQQKDNSDQMINMRYYCQALLSQGEQLQQLYTNLLNKEISMSNYTKKLTGFNHQIHLKEINNKYCNLYFQDVQRLLQNNNIGDLFELFVMYMAPINDGNISDLQIKIKKYEKIIHKQFQNHKIINILRKIVDTSYKRCIAYDKFNKDHH